MYFVVPCRATIVIRLRIVWSHHTVVAYALYLRRAHTLSSCSSGVPVHGATVQGYTGRACRGARREHAGARPMHKEVVAEPIGFRDDLTTLDIHLTSGYSRRMSTKKREVFRRGVQLGSATHLGPF